MQVRDFYIDMLEKRASDGVNPEQISTSTDSQQIANAELDSNVKDQRAQIKPLFETAAAAEKADTKLIGKLLPKAKASPDAASSNPLLKVATHQAFFDGLRKTDLLKTASPDYIKAAYTGFEQELQKISAFIGAAAKPLMGALQAAKKAPSAVKSLAGKDSTTMNWGKFPPVKAAGLPA